MNKLQTISKKIQEVSKELTDVLFGFIRPSISHIISILDEGKISARLALFSGIGMTVYALLWAMSYAESPPAALSGTDVAAIIAAVLGPIAMLTGALMKYGESVLGKSSDDKYKKEDEDK